MALNFSELKRKCCQLYILTNSIEIDEKLLQNFSATQLKKRREMIMNYANNFRDLQSTFLKYENFINKDDHEDTLKKLSTIGKTLNSMLTMIELVEEKQQQQHLQYQANSSAPIDDDKLDLISQFADDYYDDDNGDLISTTQSLDCRSINNDYACDNNVENLSISMSNLDSIMRNLIVPSPVAMNNAKIETDHQLNCVSNIDYNTSATTYYLPQPISHKPEALLPLPNNKNNSSSSNGPNKQKGSKSNNIQSKKNSNQIVDKNKEFLNFIKNIIRQMERIKTDSNQSQQIDQIAKRLKNQMDSVEKIDLFVNELYGNVIEAMVSNDSQYYIKFLIRILPIGISVPIQFAQQNSISNINKSSPSKYLIRDSLLKKCNDIFFNHNVVSNDGNLFNFESNPNQSSWQKFEFYGKYLSNNILSDRRVYLANIRLISHLLRSNSFSSHSLVQYFDHLIIKNIGQHFYLECFIIMVSIIGNGVMKGLYKQNHFQLREKIFNKFSLNKYHNLNTSTRKAALFICNLEKQNWTI